MIIVLGSINVDLVASVPRLPRPGETLTGHAFRATPGGKGANQALAACRAGARVKLFGAVGNDPFSVTALALLKGDGVDVDGVQALDTATGVALIHVDDAGENTITVVPCANAMVAAEQVPSSSITARDTMVMQLEVPLGAVRTLALRARACGARVILNASPVQPLPIELAEAIDVLVVNQHEAALLAAEMRLPPTPSAFASAWTARFSTAAIVSLGGDGLVAAARGDVTLVAAPRVNVVDSVGAGDALVGAIAASLDRDTPWERALREGVAAGALACTRWGAQCAMPTRAEITTLADTVEAKSSCTSHATDMHRYNAKASHHQVKT